jgi:hypothetical protein
VMFLPFSDLKSVLGLTALKRVGRKVIDDDCTGLAEQLAYFTLFSLFPFSCPWSPWPGLSTTLPLFLRY